MGAVIGFATALGPLAGGLIIAWIGNDHGWRYVFGVNVPLGVIALIAARSFLPGRTATTRPAARADWLGLLLLTAGLVALIVPLIQGQEYDWPWWTFASLAAALILLAASLMWNGASGPPGIRR